MLDLIIVGAGPAGLATAIAAQQAGLRYLVIEKGALVNSILNFPRNMVFFTTPELLELGGVPFTTPYEKPTRAEALRYYRRVVDRFDLCIALYERVESIQKRPSDFLLRTRRVDGPENSYESKCVVVATGYYDNPNRLGIPGEDLPHVSHYYTEAHPFFRKRVLVVGGMNSAAEAALDLYRAGAHVTLAHRGAALGQSIKYWVRPDIENRIREGSIAAHFNSRVVEIRPAAAILESTGRREELPAEAVFLLTGYHPDVELLRQAGVRIDETRLAPEHNPGNFETGIAGLFLAGSVVSGKEANKIFIENGRLHGAMVVESILRMIQTGSGRS